MKKIFKFLIIIVAIAFIIFKSLEYYENCKYKINGNKLIEKVESYKKTHKKLPSNINELNIKETIGEGPYYKKENDSTYIIYFNIGFDNSLEYSSKTKKWKDKP